MSGRKTSLVFSVSVKKKNKLRLHAEIDWIVLMIGSKVLQMAEFV